MTQSPGPSLTIAKDQTGGPNPITAAGQTIDYTIVVTNTGNQTQTGVNVSGRPSWRWSNNRKRKFKWQFERRRNLDLHHQLHSYPSRH
ncbi:MAG: hypothetical protein IPK46_12690 [Saprospiraceae bacterium]|nr:hypothetical protein [Saprospiraceae bacterium]